MEAKQICSSLYEDILNEKLDASIHSIFNNSVNILDNKGRLITLINSNISMGPNAIQVKGNMSFQKLGLVKNAKVSFNPAYSFVEVSNLKINYQEAQFWDKDPIFSYDRGSNDSIEKKIKLMKDFLKAEGKDRGILPLVSSLEGRIDNFNFPNNKFRDLNWEDQFIKDRFYKFVDYYIAKDLEKLSEYARKIIGFGKGLTPSMDDFLSGLMLTQIYLLDYLDLDKEEGYRINQAIVDDIEGKTTLISKQIMMNASRAQANEDIRQLVLSLLGNASQVTFEQSLKRVNGIGETSGTDIISGILIAVTIDLRK